VKFLGGDAPGYIALTFASADGRQQFAISVTRSTTDDNDAIIPAMVKAGEAVLCPAA
jgi:D-alanyl-D-alanine carboxypeptidase